MLERKYGWTIEADIHGMRVLEAKRELETLIGRADKSIREIVVIHGYHGGSIRQCQTSDHRKRRTDPPWQRSTFHLRDFIWQKKRCTRRRHWHGTF